MVIPFRSTDVSLSFLPLSHILERMFDFLMFYVGVSIAYVESINTILENIGEIRPTLVVSVPRIYEKIYAAVLEKALAGGAAKKTIFLWARGVGDRWAAEMQAGRAPKGFLAFQYQVADKLVFSKLRERVGGRLRYFVSRRRAAGARDQQLLLRRGAAHPRRLRAHRDVAGDRREHAGVQSHRHGGQADLRHRGHDRRRRRDPHARPARDEGLLQPPRGDARSDRRRRAGSTPATSANSTMATCASPTARRTSS